MLERKSALCDADMHVFQAFFELFTRLILWRFVCCVCVCSCNKRMATVVHIWVMLFLDFAHIFIHCRLKHKCVYISYMINILNKLLYFNHYLGYKRPNPLSIQKYYFLVISLFRSLLFFWCVSEAVLCCMCNPYPPFTRIKENLLIYWWFHRLHNTNNSKHTSAS